MQKRLLNLEIIGKGPTLVLIHGVAGSLHIWDPVVKDLSADHTVVRMDLLGYGHSPKPHIRYTSSVHTEAIRSTLRHNGLMPPYTFIGLSMGVNLALEYAKQWPEDIAGFIGIGFPYYSTKEAARHGLKENTWTNLTIHHPFLAQIIIPFIWWLGRHKIIQPQKFTKIYTPIMAHDTLLNPYYVFRSNVWNCMANNPQPELLAKSDKIRRLFIQGAEDIWTCPSAIKKAIAPYVNSSLRVVPDTGHNVVVLKPDVTLGYIRDYLKST